MSDFLRIIAYGRHACLSDNEEPVAVLINTAVKKYLLKELEMPFSGKLLDKDIARMRLFGMKVEWIGGMVAISIRTSKGDIRICR